MHVPDDLRRILKVSFTCRECNRSTSETVATVSGQSSVPCEHCAKPIDLTTVNNREFIRGIERLIAGK